MEKVNTYYFRTDTLLTAILCALYEKIYFRVDVYDTKVHLA